jgi:hypothetical protein
MSIFPTSLADLVPQRGTGGEMPATSPGGKSKWDERENNRFL